MHSLAHLATYKNLASTLSVLLINILTKNIIYNYYGSGVLHIVNMFLIVLSVYLLARYIHNYATQLQLSCMYILQAFDW